MLQNPPPTGGDMAARQRQHRRQNSTPTAWEAVNIAPLPNFSNQRPARAGHRRGLSLDQRPRLLPQTRLAPNMHGSFDMVGNAATTNAGSAPAQQHIQRETQQNSFINQGSSQQQHQQQQQQQQQQQLHNFLSQQQQQQHQQPQQPLRQNRHQRHESDSFLLTPHSTPGNQHFEDFLESPQGHMGPDMVHPAYYAESMDAIIKKNQANFSNNSLADPLGFNFFADSTLSPTNMNFVFPKADPAGSGAWMSEPEMMTGESRPVSRRISNGILDKMAKFEPLLQDQPQRMITPPAQNHPDGLPHTPLETATIKHPSTAPHARLNRFSDDYDESMEETIKPVRTTRPNGIAGLFPGMDQQTNGLAQPQPQRANTTPMGFPNSLSSPGFMHMAHVKNEFGQIDTGYDTLGNLPSDLSSPSSPSPMHGHILGFGDSDSQNTIVPGRRSSPPNGASHCRTKSVASVVSATSFESININIEEARTDTGVTMDDIETYMKGPDPTDGQWVCTFEKCNKRFGRKENIKSHVQTHLNDRQYKCPVCGNCFVRQHDLKRHAKIHSGFKPYPCDCGKSFARQDALTRHRQRGMCVGALDGIVRKVVKRGRPRKNRPDLEERLDKSAKTRRKNGHAPSSSISSSFSAFSDSSSTVNSPGDHHFDDLMSDGPDGLVDVAMVDHLPCTAATLDAHGLVAISSAPMIARRSPTIVSGIASRVASPDPISSYASPIDLVADYALPTTAAHSVHCPSSPAKSVASYYTRVGSTPPGLSASSSPPPPQRQSVRFFDHWDPSASNSAFDPSSDTVTAPSSSMPASSNTPLLESDHDGLPNMDDSGMSLLQFPADDGDGPMPFDLVGTEMYHLQIDGVGGVGGGGVVKLDEYIKEEGEGIVLPQGKDVFFGSF